ncbi:unnamed protein product [Plutella xylostella]|uniref:(diamondback moth) hypothetical protein n=1 Tax=Plutella xylostella TaxID=51655 RepID=A0A8S4GE94_PLUXY|nr:unnamed protein product [Plutella xylostella]
MINFTIKTLDGNNHSFSVEDDTTIEQLKNKIQTDLEIEPNLQRLIFCGRVLQDERPLAEYDVQGKVVHLVQRPPPSPGHRNVAPSSPANQNQSTQPDANQQATQQQMRRLMALAGPSGFDDHNISVSPTTGRMEFIRRMIADIKTEMTALRTHTENRPPPAPGSASQVSLLSGLKHT